ncbi:hypothetical protein EVAR_21482_1 [Eumeta japonica]|uniref:Uncharacterized protein n=1 Tax=Eumeta variegata TaxID=151549 RepID=A0A4C1UZ13_EUMVA|nr:hypothetical protein EVAR_21482_1 [Eumeta japonica]
MRYRNHGRDTERISLHFRRPGGGDVTSGSRSAAQGRHIDSAHAHFQLHPALLVLYCTGCVLENVLAQNRRSGVRTAPRAPAACEREPESKSRRCYQPVERFDCSLISRLCRGNDLASQTSRRVTERSLIDIDHKHLEVASETAIELKKRLDEIRLLESRKSARLADSDTDFARLADMAGDRRRASATIEVPPHPMHGINKLYTSSGIHYTYSVIRVDKQAFDSNVAVFNFVFAKDIAEWSIASRESNKYQSALTLSQWLTSPAPRAPPACAAPPSSRKAVASDYRQLNFLTTLNADRVYVVSTIGKQRRERTDRRRALSSAAGAGAGAPQEHCETCAALTDWMEVSARSAGSSLSRLPTFCDGPRPPNARRLLAIRRSPNDTNRARGAVVTMRRLF